MLGDLGELDEYLPAPELEQVSENGTSTASSSVCALPLQAQTYNQLPNPYAPSAQAFNQWSYAYAPPPPNVYAPLPPPPPQTQWYNQWSHAYAPPSQAYNNPG